MNAFVRTFGNYLLDEEIARGGMSRVYLARLRGLGGFEKRLVVKQVLPELASDPRFVSMFVTEAKTLVMMSHPHIAPVYELGVVDGVYFLAMEYVEGATLYRILEDGPLSAAMVAHIGAQTADALHYAHSRFDIVHRDVTPKNVIVELNGHTRLIDFGVAAPADDGDGELFGTPGYLSPEHLASEDGGSKGVSAASDVFSLGAVLFEALTGRRAFEARSVEDNRAQLDRGAPAFEDDDDVPAKLRAIVMRAIAIDIKARQPSARALGRELSGWLARHSPEGAAEQLSVRVADAAPKSREDVPDEEGIDEPAQPSEIKTLATSPLLRELREEDAETSDDPPGTVPIEGRRSAPDLVRGPAEVMTAPAPSKPARSPLGGWLFVGAAVLLLGGLGYALLPNDGAGGREREETARATDEPVTTNSPPTKIAQPDARADVERDAGSLDTAVEEIPDSRSRETEPVRRPGGRAPLTVAVAPWGEVYVDGELVGRAPLRAHSIATGEHVVEVRNPPLGRRVRATVRASAGRAIFVTADLNADPPAISVR